MMDPAFVSDFVFKATVKVKDSQLSGKQIVEPGGKLHVGKSRRRRWLKTLGRSGPSIMRPNTAGSRLVPKLCVQISALNWNSYPFSPSCFCFKRSIKTIELFVLMIEKEWPTMLPF